MKFFLNANVLFSAAYTEHRRTRALFRFVAVGVCSLFSSAYVVEEARRNLTRKRPEHLGVFDQLLAGALISHSADATGLAWASTLELPDKDVPILADALASGADFLVTGGVNDFGHLSGRDLNGLRVITPADAVAMVLATDRL